MNKIFLLGLLFFTTHIQAQLTESTTVDVQLKFVKNNGKVDAMVNLQYPVASNNSIQIGNLRDSYGTPSIGKFMTELEGKAGTKVSKVTKGDSIVITPAGKEVNLSYTLSFDSAALADFTYAPNTGSDHIHFAFCQWMLPLIDRNKSLAYDIRVNELPGNWIGYSSLSANPKKIQVKGSMSEIFSAIVGAGIFYKKTFVVRGKPLSVFINGKFDVGHEKLAKMAYQTVSYQHSLFNDFRFDYYNVVLLPKPGNIAGISIPNMFLCHLKRDVEYGRLAWLMSHEMQHRWIGNTIALKDTTASRLRHQWFKEGINDYLAYVALLASKSFTKDEFVNGINEYLKNIKENPYAAVSADSIEKLATLGKYGVVATKLAYYKGGLIGLIADKEFLKQTKSGVYSGIKDMMVQLVKNKSSQQERIELDDSIFFTMADSMQLPLQALYRKHIVDGSDDFDLPATLFNNAYTLKKTNYHVYDLGLSYVDRNGKLFAASVLPEGPAYKAGIRNDMEIVSTTSVNRFSNAWCDCPVILRVKTGGVEKTISYLPRGKTTEVLQYVKN